MGVSTAQKKKKERPAGDEPDPEQWMVTFGDLLSLLITFFVLLFSMGTLDEQILEEMFFSSFIGGAGALSFGERVSVESLKAEKIIAKRQQGIKQFYEWLLEKDESDKMLTSLEGLAQSLLATDVIIKRRGPSFVLSFPSANMFEPGGAELRPEIKQVLSDLGQVLRFSESEIIIEGHTDDIPISTLKFPSNWELSATRSANVMRYFKDETPVNVDRLGIIGFADSQPLVKSISDSYRARNRRIEIVIRQAPEF